MEVVVISSRGTIRSERINEQRVITNIAGPAEYSGEALNATVIDTECARIAVSPRNS